MEKKEFELAVFIGRLQPYHLAHHALVQKALEIADKAVVVLGSSFRARDPKNPFTWTERRDMVKLSFSEDDAQRLSFIPVRDYYDDDSWVTAIREEIAQRFPGVRNIALVGHFKDASSYYLNRFPGWKLVEQNTSLEDGLSATQLRDALFSKEAGWPVIRAMAAPSMPVPVMEYLNLWRHTAAYEQMRDEQEGLQNYRKLWSDTPYEVLFVTVDAVVRCNGHVLLVQRGRSPGKGLWALPGGFLESKESLLQSAVRELREETSLDVMGYCIEHALKDVKVFDHPNRSLRGRTLTHAHYFDLGERRHLPEVRAADDAAEVRWVPVEELSGMEESLFEDHATILQAMPVVAAETNPV